MPAEFHAQRSLAGCIHGVSKSRTQLSHTHTHTRTHMHTHTRAHTRTCTHTRAHTRTHTDTHTHTHVHTHAHTVEHYSAIRNETVAFAATWMGLEVIILRT